MSSDELHPANQWGLQKMRQLLDRLDADLKAIPYDLSGLKTQDDFLVHLVPLMGHSIHLMHYAALLAPNRDVAEHGWPFQKAVVVGHFVRLRKLLAGIAFLVIKRQFENAAVLTRPMYETDARMRYLFTAKRATFRSFLLTSYQAERDMLAELKVANPNQTLQKVGKRIRGKIVRRLKRDRIPLKALEANKHWKLDGKSIRVIMAANRPDELYKYGFGTSSHYVHGDWNDLTWHHLDKAGRRWKPRLEWKSPRAELVIGATIIGLDAMLAYVKWGKLDPTGAFPATAELIAKEVWRLDAAHEALES